MPWDAIESLDDARGATESLLLPVSWRTWLRLAVVTFFVGGVGGGGSAGQAIQGAVSSPPAPGVTLDRIDAPTIPPVSPESVGVLVIGVVVAAVALATVYALVGAVMEFVLVDGLRTRQVELRRPTRQFLVPGLRLFAFRTVVVVVLAVSAALSLLLLFGVLSVSVAGVLFVPVLVGFVALVWLVGVVALRLTTDLVVPTMLVEGRTVLSAWRRVLPLARAAWREVALYLVLRLVLGVAASLVVGLVVGLAALVVAIPFALLGAVVVFTVGLRGAGLVAVVGLASVFVLLVVGLSVVVQVPVVTYFRYYGLALLGRFDDRLDLVQSPSASGSPSTQSA